MTELWHVEVSPLPTHDGWLLSCTERPELAIRLSTLDNMGGRIAEAIAEALGRPDTRDMSIHFSYPQGDITLYHLTREPGGTISVDQVPGLWLSGASRTEDLVQAIAVADGVPTETVGIVFEDS